MRKETGWSSTINREINWQVLREVSWPGARKEQLEKKGDGPGLWTQSGLFEYGEGKQEKGRGGKEKIGWGEGENNQGGGRIKGEKKGGVRGKAQKIKKGKGRKGGKTKSWSRRTEIRIISERSRGKTGWRFGCLQKKAQNGRDRGRAGRIETSQKQDGLVECRVGIFEGELHPTQLPVPIHIPERLLPVFVLPIRGVPLVALISFETGYEFKI